jgi:orotate phosphoribosyltransferase
MYSPSFASPTDIAQLSAKALLDIEAVLFNASQPYIFTSGWASPVYIDCRKVISFPQVRSMLVDFSVSTIMRNVPMESIDCIAGGETAGIPYAAWIADRMGLPMQYVRKKPKGFGRNAQIEGYLPEDSRVLLVEDLTTDGKSKVNFAEALRSAGTKVDHTFVVFYYGIFPETPAFLKQHGMNLHYLTTWWDVLAAAKQNNRFDTATLTEVEAFLHDPITWSAAHGGRNTLEA